MFILISSLSAWAQQPADSLKLADPIIKADTLKKGEVEPVVKKKKVRTPKDPNTAVFRSAVVPGLGQIYNQRYWKLPIIYGGFVALGYAINFNQKYYNEFVNEYILRTDGDPSSIPNPDYKNAPDEQIISVKDFYKRNRDISIIGTVALYAAQVIDAYVDAELSNFDVSDDLSLKIGPSINQSFAYRGMPSYSVGLSLKFTLKK
ncbi:hypothetical protein C3K47_09310 [Solitalea longa]|uniref:DUF5683 domain-containing protein n=1 Tax=Solitalea longa TaxID=2079460 RepID=A0A2S5A369_9SPHI|nr:hypothetical protein C3K47_09310 [Solitalea longa]